ncbi:MAG: hypothetical protein AABN34_20075 [Acidobacteriota bacterium]
MFVNAYVSYLNVPEAVGVGHEVGEAHVLVLPRTPGRWVEIGSVASIVPVHEIDPPEHVPQVPAVSGAAIGFIPVDLREPDATESPETISAIQAVRQRIGTTECRNWNLGTK